MKHTAESVAQFLLDRRGYVVFATPLEYFAGDIVGRLPSHTGRDLEHSTVVTKTTDFDDFREQITLLHELTSDQAIPKKEDFDGWNFYRMVAE